MTSQKPAAFEDLHGVEQRTLLQLLEYAINTDAYGIKNVKGILEYNKFLPLDVPFPKRIIKNLVNDPLEDTTLLGILQHLANNPPLCDGEEIAGRSTYFPHIERAYQYIREKMVEGKVPGVEEKYPEKLKPDMIAMWHLAKPSVRNRRDHRGNSPDAGNPKILRFAGIEKIRELADAIDKCEVNEARRIINHPDFTFRSPGYKLPENSPLRPFIRGNAPQTPLEHAEAMTTICKGSLQVQAKQVLSLIKNKMSDHGIDRGDYVGKAK